jgi:hypothetical protein
MTARKIQRFLLALLATLSFSSAAATAVVVVSNTGAHVAASPNANSWR